MPLPIVGRHFSLKLFSFLVSLLLFFFVSVESVTPIEVDFPIVYDVPDDMLIMGRAPTSIHTTLQGPWAAFQDYTSQDVEPIVIKLEQVGPGVLRHRIQASDILAPAGMKIIAFRPAEIELSLDRKSERLIPVSADLIDRPAFGFEIADVRVEPKAVAVEGPISMVQTLDFAYTRPIDISGRESSLSLEIDLKPMSAPLRLKTSGVQVQIEIVEQFVERTFENVRVQLSNAPEGSRVSPEKVVVYLKGPRKVLGTLNEKVLVAKVDIKDDLPASVDLLEKAVKLEGVPERTLWTGLAPKVKVQLPKRR